MDGTIYLFVFVAIVLVFFLIRSRKRNFLLNEKKAQLKSLYKHQAIFLCDNAEDLGNNLVQFYGEPFGISVQPGMKISDPNGEEYAVKEVYASGSTKPDLEIPNGMTNTAIVIETNSFNLKNLRKNIKREGVVALKLQ